MDVSRQLAAPPTGPDTLGFLVGEGLDHWNSSKRCQVLSAGRQTCQKRQPFTLLPEIALAASDGLVLTIPFESIHSPFLISA